MLKKCRYLIFIVLLMVSMPVWAVDPNVKDTLNIFNFGGVKDVEIFEAAHERFKKRFPNVKINNQMVPVSASWATYINKLLTQIAGGTSPDIVNIAIEGVQLLVSKDVMMPLGKFVENDADAKVLLEDIAPALVDVLKVENELYFFPHSWNNMVMYYNKSLFDEAGIPYPSENWTWQEFLEIAQKLTKKDASGKTIQWGYEIPNFNFGLTPWFLTNDTLQLSADWKKSNLDDPKMLESLQFLTDLVHKYKVAPSPGIEDNMSAEQLFTTGKLAMLSRGHWPIQTFYANDFRNFDVQYMPSKQKRTSVFGVGGYGIMKSSPNQELAWELIKEYLSKETMNATAGAGVAIPARRSEAYSEVFLKHPENSKVYYDSINDAKAVPSPPNFGKFDTIFMRHVNLALLGGTSPEQALADAHKELSKAMKRVK